MRNPTVVSSPVLTEVTLDPEGAVLAHDGTQQFSATGLDQFGDEMAEQPSFTWSVEGGGTIVDGLYTPPSDSTGVTATAEGISGAAEIKVVANDTSGEEFYIGASGTFAVPAGAIMLYLGLHDGACWHDNGGSISVQLD